MRVSCTCPKCWKQVLSTKIRFSDIVASITSPWIYCSAWKLVLDDLRLISMIQYETCARIISESFPASCSYVATETCQIRQCQLENAQLRLVWWTLVVIEVAVANISYAIQMFLINLNFFLYSSPVLIGGKPKWNTVKVCSIELLFQRRIYLFKLVFQALILVLGSEIHYSCRKE